MTPEERLTQAEKLLETAARYIDRHSQMIQGKLILFGLWDLLFRQHIATAKAVKTFPNFKSYVSQDFYAMLTADS